MTQKIVGMVRDSIYHRTIIFLHRTRGHLCAGAVILARCKAQVHFPPCGRGIECVTMTPTTTRKTEFGHRLRFVTTDSGSIPSGRRKCWTTLKATSVNGHMLRNIARRCVPVEREREKRREWAHRTKKVVHDGGIAALEKGKWPCCTQ